MQRRLVIDEPHAIVAARTPATTRPSTIARSVPLNGVAGSSAGSRSQTDRGGSEPVSTGGALPKVSVHNIPSRPSFLANDKPPVASAKKKTLRQEDLVGSDGADRFGDFGDHIITLCLQHVRVCDVAKARLTCRRVRSIELRSFLPNVLRSSFDEDERHQLLLARFCKANATWPATVLPMLLQSGVPVDRTDRGRSLLWISAINSHTDTVVALLAAAADVNHKGSIGQAPLWIAANEGRTSVVRALLAAGANVDQADNRHGITPLSIATQHGHTGTVAALLAAGASVNRADNFGQTPIDIAANDETSYSSFRGGRRFSGAVVDALRMAQK